LSLTALFSGDLFNWVILPILIFLARVTDVTIGTIRIIAVARGNKVVAPLLGFFEILIWLLAMTQIFQNLNNPVCFIAYAAGFATGNWVGIKLEERLAFGKIILRIITKHNALELITKLRQLGFGVTNIPAEGSTGPVSVIYILLDRADLHRVEKQIQKFNPKAFYIVEDVRFFYEGIFPPQKSLKKKILPKAPRAFRMARIAGKKVSRLRK